MTRFILLLFTSFFLVAFGQGAWIPYLGLFSAAFGFALFWRAMLTLPKSIHRFWLSCGWFAAVQAVQLSWMTSTEYMGSTILVVYAILILAIGAQFGLLSLFFAKYRHSLTGCLATAGCWVFLEWIRLFPFSGFTWNPVGLALADSPLSIQFASLFGIFGLSFWVIFVNAFALYAQAGKIAIWAFFALFPSLFGWGHQWWMEKTVPHEHTLSTALVQTAILPEQKDPYPGRPGASIPPLNQWERIFSSLSQGRSLDLIVLPEAAVSMSAYRPSYPMDLVTRVWARQFGEKALSSLPPLSAPFAQWNRQRERWYVTNAFIAQGLANHFRAHVIAGFDDQNGSFKYNAAFHFHPGNALPQRYEKRILVPVGEYVPFPKIQWLAQFLIDQFGIGDSFHTGTEAKIFGASLPIGVSICLEETYSDLVRDLRRKGAHLLVNMSNDVWFPRSRLPQHHFQHGKVRAAENGVYVLRSCNTGITGGIDCFGRTIASLPPSENEMGVLYLKVPIRCFSTLYTWWGDQAILVLSACFFVLPLVQKRSWTINRFLR